MDQYKTPKRKRRWGDNLHLYIMTETKPNPEKPIKSETMKNEKTHGKQKQKGRKSEGAKMKSANLERPAR